jgi:hypothetical protein
MHLGHRQTGKRRQLRIGPALVVARRERQQQVEILVLEHGLAVGKSRHGYRMTRFFVFREMRK